MIDTIKILFNEYEIPKNYRDYLLTFENNQIKRDENNKITITARIKNIQIKLDQRGIKIEGSLTKYLYNDNFKSATKLQLIKAIECLSQTLKLDLLKGRVSRLDISENIILNYPVKEYFTLLNDSKHFERLELPNGLSYHNTNRYISFYDKRKELKLKRVPIDEIFKNRNILRFEYCYKNNKALSCFLKIPKCRVLDIFENYSNLIDEWLRIFKCIDKKSNPLCFNIEKINSPKSLYKQLQLQGILHLNGLQEVLRMIKSAKERGGFKKYANQATNIRNSLKNLMKLPNLIEEFQLTEELEKKINLIHYHAYPK